MPGDSYRRRLMSLLLCLCDVFRALILLLLLSLKSRASLGVIHSGSGGSLFVAWCHLKTTTDEWLKGVNLFTGSWVNGHGAVGVSCGM